VGRDAEGEAFFDTTATTVGVVGDAFTTYDNRNGAGYDLDLADPLPIEAGSIQAHN
jgi:hypothetical protein